LEIEALVSHNLKHFLASLERMNCLFNKMFDAIIFGEGDCCLWFVSGWKTFCSPKLCIIIVVKVTQNWRNWGFWKLSIRGPNRVVRGPNLSAVFCLLVRQKSVAEWRNSGPEFASRKYNRNVFLGQICYNFMGVTFTINIGFVSK